MIEVINGDIISHVEDMDILIHQCNTSNTMGAGLAKALSNKWPEVLEVDTECYQRALDSNGGVETNVKYYLLGKFSITNPIPVGGHKFRVVNLYGQQLGRSSLAGCPTDYNAVVKGLTDLVSFLKDEGEPERPIRVGAPYFMGCGLGKGNWGIYSSIMNNIFSNDIFEPLKFYKL